MTRIALVLTVAALCGCQKPDPAVAKLQKRMDAMSAILTNLAEWNTSTIELLQKSLEPNAAKMVTLQKDYHASTLKIIETQSGRIADISERVDGLAANLDAVDVRLNNAIRSMNQGTRQPITPAAGKPATPAANKWGIPAAVYDQIAESARKEWPTDFQHQEYEIKIQVTAWQNLNR